MKLDPAHLAQAVASCLPADTPPEMVEQLMTEIFGPDIDTIDNVEVPVRPDCAFCGYERTPADDNHSETCAYWTVS